MPDQHAMHAGPDAGPDAGAGAASSGRMECGVCWYVYDPAQGDDVWQVAPGTAFADLPDHWRCPECDAEKHKFMPLDGVDGVDAHSPAQGLAGVEALIAAYRRVDQDRMQDLPFRNAALGVAAVGFQDWQGCAIGVVITPWFMNLVLLPGADTDWSAHRHGDLVTHVLPSGVYEFVHGDLEGFGLVQSCSLQSPVPEFESMDAARATAAEVMRLIFAAPEGEAEPQGPALKPAVDGEAEQAAAPRGDLSRQEARGDISRQEARGDISRQEARGEISRRDFLRGGRAKAAPSDD